MTAAVQPRVDAAWAFGIAPLAREKLATVFERAAGLDAVWIYGSRARGNHQLASDIDLAVDVEQKLHARLLEAIEELQLLYEVEVVNLAEHIAPAFRDRIQRDRQLFWRRVSPPAA
jgi:predicted nucleotidyltransferase